MDIMCNDIACEINEHCERFTAPPGTAQFYRKLSPIDGGRCRSFQPNYSPEPEMPYHEVGEEFWHDGVKLVIKQNDPNDGCAGCHFFNYDGRSCVGAWKSRCLPTAREDSKFIIYETVSELKEESMDIGKVTVKQVNSYEITINGIVHTGFVRGEDWRGMVEFRKEGASIIVHKNDSMSALFVGLLSDEQVKEETLSIVKISPSLIR